MAAPAAGPSLMITMPNRIGLGTKMGDLISQTRPPHNYALEKILNVFSQFDFAAVNNKITPQQFVECVEESVSEFLGGTKDDKALHAALIDGGSVAYAAIKIFTTMIDDEAARKAALDIWSANGKARAERLQEKNAADLRKLLDEMDKQKAEDAKKKADEGKG